MERIKIALERARRERFAVEKPAALDMLADFPVETTEEKSSPALDHRRRPDAPVHLPVELHTVDLDLPQGSERSEAKSVVDATHTSSLLRGLQTRLGAQFSLADLGIIAFVGTSPGDGVTALSTAFATGVVAAMHHPVILFQISGEPAASRHKFCCKEPLSLEHVLRLSPSALSQLATQPKVLRVVPGENGEHTLTAALQSGRLSELLARLRQKYPHIVIDCPPLPNSTETLAIARHADGVILVVRAGVTRKRVARAAIRVMEQAGVRPLGALLNRRRLYVPEWLYRRI